MLTMYDFPSIDEVNIMLDLIAEELPKEFYNRLNEGIVLLEEHKIHPESKDGDELYIMGEYIMSNMGRRIAIYYGSFQKLFNGSSYEKVYIRLKETLLHEFTHHLESLAGEKGLEIKDAEEMRAYREKAMKKH